MCYYVIKSNGKVQSCTSVQKVTNLEMQTHEVKVWYAKFDKALEERLCDNKFVINEGAKTQPIDWCSFHLEAD